MKDNGVATQKTFTSRKRLRGKRPKIGGNHAESSGKELKKTRKKVWRSHEKKERHAGKGSKVDRARPGENNKEKT